ncbi:MAG: KpsF/GutQ family sugar-phosphate isomerase, partial [Sedimentisphaerales bacterium]|nr:KpsF/GutQ family sugar-phosphate isomerase [Sedimentisphaerales bacterium]
MAVKAQVKIELEEARQLILREAAALSGLAENLDDGFATAVRMMYECKGSVVVTGIGKAGIVGQKISATLASTGTPSHFLHAAEAVHGDLGRLRDEDVAMVLSHSGSSEEIVRLIALIKQLGNKMIGITGKLDSPLAQHSDVTVSLGRIEEICPLGLAPTASTTCMLALGDALAITVMKMRDFQSEDYARYHPGGALGRQLVTVEQAALFTRGKPLPMVSDKLTVSQAIAQADAQTEMRHGSVLLVDEAGRLSGIITDGDLRRALEKQGAKLQDCPVARIMTTKPTVVRPNTLASEAMAIFHEKRIDEIPVVDEDGRPVGLIDVQDVVALKVVQ